MSKAPAPRSAHDKAWEKLFITPLAKKMKKHGVAYLMIIMRDDGKAAYVLEPEDDGIGAHRQNLP